MPGLGRDMVKLGGAKKKELVLGTKLEEFISIALLDFTHMTVLMFMVREAGGGCSVGQVAKVTGDSKAAIVKVLDRFEQLKVVRSSGGLFGKKYAYERNGPRAELVSRMIKLWEHRAAHELILKKILAPRK